MIRHFFTIALRAALRNLNFTLINVLGLAIGLASFIFIMIYIEDEMKYDDFHSQTDNIYRLNRLYNSNDINEDASTCSFPCGPAMLADYSDMIETQVRFFDFQISKLLFEYKKGDTVLNAFKEEWFYMVDSTVFDVFDFPFLEGDSKTALDRPATIVISESTAKRYFGEESALGKVLRMENFQDLEITGVMEDIPQQSHFRIDMLASMATYRSFLPGNRLPDNWIWNPCWTYLLLPENVNPKHLEKNFDSFYRNHYPDFQNQEMKLYLQKLSDIHLHSQHDYEMRVNSNIIFVKILSIIAFFVLILACINFMNLATASSTARKKEIGLKRMLGARKSGLTLHFLAEAILMTALAFFFAAIIVELLLPAFNNFTFKQIEPGIFVKGKTILLCVLMIFVVGLVAGSYPAFYLSNISHSRLKGNERRNRNTALARKILVVVQFSVSIALIIATITIYKQLNYLRSAELGYNKNQHIIIPSFGAVSQQYEVFAEEIKAHKDVINVTGMEDVFGFNHNTRAYFVEGLNQDEPFYFPAFIIRHEFVETFDIEVVEGRSFSRDFPSDTANAIMINEMMAKNMGWTNEEAIGKSIRADGDEKVIGVIKNFNALSLHKPVSNFLFDMMRDENVANGLTRYIAIKVNTENYQDILSYLEEVWTRFDPSRPFEYFFLDDKLNSMYRDEEKFSNLSFILTILALFIACLGLVGLTSFLVVRKTKEICIRKIHGASVRNIQYLLSREFLLLILLANALSWPVAYFATKDWLETFSRHIPIQWTIFISSGIMTLILAYVIISFHSFKAFLGNPSDTLRYE